MSDNNKTYRIRTKIGVNQGSPIGDKYLTVKLTEKVDTIDIMSLEIKQENAYRFHSADYGVIVGRALANGGFGVPNVKVSIFIPADEATQNDQIYNAIYPYTRPIHKNRDGIRYNLLPDTPEDDCYQVVGTFPSKRMVLDDDNYMEIYDKYYKFTTRTNSAGDYMIFGVPTGSHTIHFDADLSDVGILSQRPRDMVYKGYNINQFENANQFKKDTNLANLPQIISQDDSVYVYPFWGNETENIIGITRHDIDINYKFEPTCVFIGSIISDTGSNHISKKCIPTQSMGLMEELVAGSGTIEMIRKKQNGDVEQFNIHGTQLINDNGVWCYQIPMNLDYMITDEYGNLVPSDDPTKGIATRTSVRFRISMNDFENDSENSFRTKVLVPNNPRNENGTPDYVFGSLTEDESFRDLLWNNVYTVKSFIPRFQKGNGDRLRRFSGIKECNYHGQNNPVPYNNMRVNLSFQFVIACLLVRLIIWLVGIVNTVVTVVVSALKSIYEYSGVGQKYLKTVKEKAKQIAESLSCIYVDGETCDNLEGTWFFAPKCGKDVNTAKNDVVRNIWVNMFAKVEGKKNGDVDYRNSAGGNQDQNSIDVTNADDKHKNQTEVVVAGSGKTYDYVISRGIDYFLQCIEISLAKEYRVIQFDFYNDWLNGVVYIPRWERTLRKKRRHGERYIQVRACNDGYEKRFLERNNKLTEQCAVTYKGKIDDNHIVTYVGCRDIKKLGNGYKCHEADGRKQFYIFRNGGAVHQEQTASKLYAYYFKPCEVYRMKLHSSYTRVNLFATDIVLLGSLSECNLYGIPVFTNELSSTSYQLPPSVASTDSTEEGFKYKANDVDSGSLLTANTFNGVFDFNEQTIGTSDDGSVTEESGIDWSYAGPGQGSNDIAQTYTPGGHFLGISCVNSETTIKSCVNLKRICEVGVWPSTRQEVFNGMSGGSESFLDIIPNGFIAKDDISDGSFRKMFATMNSNGLRTKVTDDGFVTYDFQ